VSDEGVCTLPSIHSVSQIAQVALLLLELGDALLVGHVRAHLDKLGP